MNTAKYSQPKPADIIGLKANAAGVGYIDYQKVQENYGFAQQAVKEIDSKALEKDLPEIYNKFLKETHSTRFTLNAIKG